MALEVIGGLPEVEIVSLAPTGYFLAPYVVADVRPEYGWSITETTLRKIRKGLEEKGAEIGAIEIFPPKVL